MGELTKGDAAMLRRLRSKRDAGSPTSRAVPLPDGVRVADGSVRRHLDELGGYRGAFRLTTNHEGKRVAALLDFDKPGAWS